MTTLDTLAQPLWRQGYDEARARRTRLLLTLPLLVPLAFASAPYAAAQLQAPYVTAAVVVLVCFLLLLYISSLVESAFLALLRAHERELLSKSIAIGCDIVIGSVIGRVLAAALDTNLYAAITVGATTLPLYNVIVSQLVLGGLGESIARLFVMQGGIPAPPQYSRADALAARAQYDEALAELDNAARAAPRDPRPLLHGARMLRDRARRYVDAVTWFRRARQRMQVPSELDAHAGRELAELLLYRMRQPERALAELARLAHTYRDTAVGKWAAAELKETKPRVIHE